MFTAKKEERWTEADADRARYNGFVPRSKVALALIIGITLGGTFAIVVSAVLGVNYSQNASMAAVHSK